MNLMSLRGLAPADRYSRMKDSSVCMTEEDGRASQELMILAERTLEEKSAGEDLLPLTRRNDILNISPQNELLA